MNVTSGVVAFDGIGSLSVTFTSSGKGNQTASANTTNVTWNSSCQIVSQNNGHVVYQAATKKTQTGTFRSVQRYGHDERDLLIGLPKPFTDRNKQRREHDGADEQSAGKRQNDGNRYRRTSITKPCGSRLPGVFLCPSFTRWLFTELSRTARAAGLPLPTDRCRILPMPNSLGDPCPRQPLLHLASPTLIGCADLPAS